MRDHLGCRDSFEADGKTFAFYSLKKLGEKHAQAERLPYSLKILLENLLRHEDGVNITESDIAGLANWDPRAEPDQEIAFTPARVVLQDFTGVPAIVDLAAMRDAMKKLGGNPNRINPLSPAELVIDHSVQVDNYGRADALDLNNQIEFQRNKERYAFLRWGQGPSATSASCRPTPASCTRSTSSTSRGWCSARTASPTPTRWSAPTRTPP
jgi:aconitate hydratase